MLLCQPPITEMEAEPKCCVDDWPWLRRNEREHQDRKKSIHSANGITVADLITTAKALGDKHRNCPNASFEQHDTDGEVRAGTVFKGILALQDDDPELRPNRARETRSRSPEYDVSEHAYCDSSRGGPTELERYVEDKRTG